LPLVHSYRVHVKGFEEKEFERAYKHTRRNWSKELKEEIENSMLCMCTIIIVCLGYRGLSLQTFRHSNFRLANVLRCDSDIFSSLAYVSLSWLNSLVQVKNVDASSLQMWLFQHTNKHAKTR
jgi:hypothetical protein